MTVEVIVATTQQQDYTLHNKMSINGNAIICNQTTSEEVRTIVNGSQRIRYISTMTKGSSSNRNMGLLRASDEILLFADDDVVYHADYEEKIRTAFRDNPNADVIFFNMKIVGGTRKESALKRRQRIHWLNAFKFGTVRIAIRRKSQQKSNIWFNLNFGPGSLYPMGEDSLFISDCLKKRLRLIAVPIEIGTVHQDSSSWFCGYNRQYFQGKGILFAAISKRLYPFFIMHHTLKHSKKSENLSKKEVAQIMYSEAKKYLKEISSTND